MNTGTVLSKQSVMNFGNRAESLWGKNDEKSSYMFCCFCNAYVLYCLRRSRDRKERRRKSG